MDACVQLACREPSALGYLYDAYYDRIFRFCAYRVGCTTTAEDICSAVWLSVAKSVKNFAGESETDFRRWIYTIAVNEIQSYYRKQGRQRKHLKLIAEEQARRAENGETEQPEWKLMHDAISKLRPDQQTIITLRFFEKMAFDEIAEVVGYRSVTVRVIMHRCLKKLHKSLSVSGLDYRG